MRSCAAFQAATNNKLNSLPLDHEPTDVTISFFTPGLHTVPDFDLPVTHRGFKLWTLFLLRVAIAFTSFARKPRAMIDPESD